MAVAVMVLVFFATMRPVVVLLATIRFVVVPFAPVFSVVPPGMVLAGVLALHVGATFAFAAPVPGPDVALGVTVSFSPGVVAIRVLTTPAVGRGAVRVAVVAGMMARFTVVAVITAMAVAGVFVGGRAAGHQAKGGQDAKQGEETHEDLLAPGQAMGNVFRLGSF